jgi:5-methylcytosine-specific restriction endonuclease McrA
MAEITLYKIASTNSHLIDALMEFERIDEESSALILHSQSGGPPRNEGYAVALIHILGRLVPDWLAAVLIDSSTTSGSSRAQRILCTGEELKGMTTLEISTFIRAKARRYGQKDGTKGGNSTKRLRLEANLPLHSLITTIHVHKVGTRPSHAKPQPHMPVSRPMAEKLLADVPFTDEDISCVENEKRMAYHFRTERSRSSKLPKAKRAAIMAVNGRFICEGENCPVDWYEVFPAHVAEGIFEVHHRVPLHHLDKAVMNTVDDLQMLCASCHRAEHRRLSSM